MKKSSKNIVVVYHDSCVDGLTSAWALHQKWASEPQTSVTYIPYAHHKTKEAESSILAALQPDAEIYFVDIAPRKALLNELMSPDVNGNKKVLAVHILDHHLTAAKNLAQYRPPVVAGFTPPALDIQIEENHPSASSMIWNIMLPGRATPSIQKAS